MNDLITGTEATEGSMTHDATIERVEDERGVRAVVRHADDDIWISDELWDAALSADRERIPGDLQIDGDIIQVGTDGEGLGRLTYRRIDRGAHWHIAVREVKP